GEVRADGLTLALSPPERVQTQKPFCSKSAFCLFRVNKQKLNHKQQRDNADGRAEIAETAGTELH
ncbi:hypothetical protein, partial [Enterobacter sichuanensis]